MALSLMQRIGVLLTGELPWVAKPVAAPDAPRVRPLTPYTSTDLALWRSSEPHVEYASTLLATPMFRELLGTLANLRPLPRGPLDATSATLALGQRQGCDIVLGAIQLAAELAPLTPTADVLADYGASDVNWEEQA